MFTINIFVYGLWICIGPISYEYISKLVYTDRKAGIAIAHGTLLRFFAPGQIFAKFGRVEGLPAKFRKDIPKFWDLGFIIVFWVLSESATHACNAFVDPEVTAILLWHATISRVRILWLSRRRHMWFLVFMSIEIQCKLFSYITLPPLLPPNPLCLGWIAQV